MLCAKRAHGYIYLYIDIALYTTIDVERRARMSKAKQPPLSPGQRWARSGGRSGRVAVRPDYDLGFDCEHALEITLAYE
mgnify:FL=1